MTQDSSRPQKIGHFDFIDGIRALAALFVVVCHAYYEPSNGFYGDTAPWLYKLGLSNGRIAVVTFIVVSGFCLMLPIARRGDEMGTFAEYMKRRCRRILPPYYAALTLAILFSLTVAAHKTGTIWDLCLPVTWQKTLSQYLLLHNMPILNNYPQPVNYPLWSIAVEFQIYFFMPLILMSLRRWGNVPTIAIAFLFGAAIFYGLPHEWRKTSLWFVALFTFGAIAARESVRRVGPLPSAWRWATFGLWAAAAVVMVTKGHDMFGSDMLVGVAAALLLMVSMADTERGYTLTRLLSWRPLVAVGLFSYSLYLIHAPMMHALFLLVHAFAHPSAPQMFGILLLCLPVIIGAAYLFYLAFERPFLSASAKARKAGANAPPSAMPVAPPLLADIASQETRSKETLSALSRP